MTAATGATGLHVWLASKGFSWLTPPRMRWATVLILTIGMLAASARLGGA